MNCPAFWYVMHIISLEARSLCHKSVEEQRHGKRRKRGFLAACMQDKQAKHAACISRMEEKGLHCSFP